MPSRKQKPPLATESLMTLAQVADYLKVAQRTVYLWAQSGKMPSFKLGNIWRFKRTEIDAWIEEQRLATPRKTAG